MPAAPIAPKYSWPSAPMLNRRIRNATAAASPVNASGVAAMSVLPSAPSARKPASNNRRNVVGGEWPVAVSSTAMAASATTSDPKRDRDHQPAPLVQALLDPHLRQDHRAVPAASSCAPSTRGSPGAVLFRIPAMSNPISSTVAVRASTSPTIAALVHHRDPVGQRQHLVEVLADQQDRDVSFGSLAQVAVHRLDRADVEPASRGRSDEHPRPARELPRQDDLLEVPARELAGRSVGSGRLHVVAADHLHSPIAQAPQAQERPSRVGCGTTSARCSRRCSGSAPHRCAGGPPARERCRR